MPIPIDTQSPVSNKSQLFKSLLGGALLGLAGGLASDPNKPGSEIQGAVRNVLGFRQQQLGEQLAVRQDAREEARVGLERQRVGLEEKRLGFDIAREMSGDALRKAQMAHLQVQIEVAQRQLALLPADRQEAMVDELRKKSQALASQGVPYEENEDFNVLRKESLNRMQKDGTFDYIVLPHPEKKDSFALFKVPSTTTKHDEVIQFGNGRYIKVPAGTAMNEYFSLQAKSFADLLDRDTKIAVAKIATQRAQERESLTLKDAMTQARQEIAQIVNAETDQGLPMNRRTYKSADDVAKAVQKRTTEILDFAARLRRGGIENPMPVVGLISQLQQLKKRGANEHDLKSQIAQFAATGQLGPAEIVAAYDALGLSPSQTQPQPQPTNPPTGPAFNDVVRTPGSGSSSIQ